VASKTAVRAKRASKPAKTPVRAPAKPAKSTARKRASPAPSKRPPPPSGRRTPAAPKRATPRAHTRAAPGFALSKIHQVALQATNLDAAVDFYRDVLGLRFVTRFDPPGLAFFDLGGGIRLLLSATASEATLYFRVANIQEAVKALKKRGVAFLQPPAMIHKDEGGELGKRGTEEWMAFFKDPSGNLLALSELR
jgi:catechol 2,3-dioxygenase-like lactoylglutathione lyase family enzyme